MIGTDMPETNYYPLVSVIIPIYNVEAYIERCIASIVNQTYDNLEIILIDDGSTDSSGQLCDKLSRTDSRIKAFHFENGGVSVARNRGVERVHGSWICFVDPDDYIGENHIMNLLSTALGANVLLAITSDETTLCGNEISAKKVVPTEYIILEPQEAMRVACEGSLFVRSVCARLFSSQLAPFLHFPEGKYYEDAFVTYRLLHAAGKVVYENACDYYHVRMRPSSTTATVDKKLLDLIDADEELIAFANNKSLEVAKTAALRAYYSHLLRIYAQFTVQNESSLAKIAHEKIVANRDEALKGSIARRPTKIAYLASYLPEALYRRFIAFNERRAQNARKKEWLKKA